jgi:hypothetical protein
MYNEQETASKKVTMNQNVIMVTAVNRDCSATLFPLRGRAVVPRGGMAECVAAVGPSV